MKKKKIRVYGKIELFETSAVGIPAYPFAHASLNNSSFSLIKALTLADLKPKTDFVEERESLSEQLNNIEEDKKEPMEEKSIESVPEVKEVKEAEAEVTKEEIKENENLSEIIAKAIKDGIKEGIDLLETQRGVVKETPKQKSLGELAIEHGLFVAK